MTHNCQTLKISMPSGKVITAETARTPSEQRRGLAFRESLLPDHGMIFIFSKPDRYPFWMRDTKIPLDIIWMKDKVVVEMTELAPPDGKTIPTYTPHKAADSVLELPAGQAEKLAITPGVELTWVDPCHRSS
jgi:uncharacterized membrane protein (UPF0127 family)